MAKRFSFRTHGGREAALRHAQVWRDAMLALHPPESKREHAQKLKANNTSGYPGVVLGRNEHGQPRRWIAHTQLAPGQILSQSFGIKRYGYDGALALAIEARQRQLEQMEGYLAEHPVVLAILQRGAPPAPVLTPKTPVSDTPGVRLTFSKKGKPQSWTTRTVIDGVRVVASFAIATYGFDQAKALALAQRDQQLQAAAANPLPRKRPGPRFRPA